MVSILDGIHLTKEFVNAIKAFRKKKNETEFNKIAIQLIQKDPYDFALTFYTGLMYSYKKELKNILLKRIKVVNYQDALRKIKDDVADTNLKFKKFLEESYEESIDLVNISKWLLFFSNKIISAKNPELIEIFNNFYEKAFIQSSLKHEKSLKSEFEEILKIPKSAFGDDLLVSRITPIKKEVENKFDPKDILVLRGGAWKIERGESVLRYAVKVINNSQFIITSIQILLPQIPSVFEYESARFEKPLLRSKSSFATGFNLVCKNSCVGDEISGIVSYIDPSGNRRNVSIEPFEVAFVCNLLVPKQIPIETFSERVSLMEKEELQIQSDLNITNLQPKIEKILKSCNFALLQQVQDPQQVKIDAYAQGLYDKEDIALRIALKQHNNYTDLTIKGMSDRAEKLTDLLKDISIKLDDIKSINGLMKEYSTQIEEVLEKAEDPKSLLIDRLGSTEFSKIKDAWEDYESGKMEKKDFIKIGMKLIGKKFIIDLLPSLLI